MTLVVGAYLLAQSVTRPPVAEASIESELLHAIATRDADSDGLPDWEEALYGTNPKVADSLRLGMIDGQAVAKGLLVPKAIADVPTATSTPTRGISTDPSIPTPADGTLTDTFAKSFFTLYLSAIRKSPNGNLTEKDTQDIATEALAQLSQSVTRAPDFKSAQSLTVSGSGPEALKTFAIAVEEVFVSNKGSATDTETAYLMRAVKEDDATALKHLASIAKVYRSTAAGLVVLPVPSELADEDLALINALARMGEITEDFTRVNTDPLVTMLALQQYPDAVLNLGNTFIRISNVYKTSGVTFAAGEPGASFVNLIANIAAKQKSAQTP